jgi:phasin family protein
LLQAGHFIRCRNDSDSKNAKRWIVKARRRAYIRKTLQKEVIQMEPQATQLLDLYRAGVRTASDVMKASLESVERMQNQQLQLIRAALEENAKSVGQITEVKSMDELVALQARLTGSQVQRVMDYWSGVWRAAGDNQMAAARLAASQVQAVSGSLRDSAHSTAANQEKRPEPQRRSA